MIRFMSTDLGKGWADQLRADIAPHIADYLANGGDLPSPESVVANDAAFKKIVRSVLDMTRENTSEAYDVLSVASLALSDGRESKTSYVNNAIARRYTERDKLAYLVAQQAVFNDSNFPDVKPNEVEDFLESFGEAERIAGDSLLRFVQNHSEHRDALMLLLGRSSRLYTAMTVAAITADRE